MRAVRSPDADLDRAYQVASTMRLAVLVLGNRTVAATWFSLPNTAFGGMRPFDLLETNAGIQRVRSALCQTRELTR
jgi:uncharacterized protein (DUF2384 family)